MRAGSAVLAADHVVLVAAHSTTLALADVLVWVLVRRWRIADPMYAIRSATQNLVAESIQATARSPWSRLTVRLLLTMDAVVVQVFDECDRVPIDDRWDCRPQEGGGRVVGQVVPLPPPTAVLPAYGGESIAERGVNRGF